MKRTRRSAKALLLALAALLGACAQSGQPVSRVIERSRQTAPDWISVPSDTPARQRLIVTKDRVHDLPLGLSQVQTSAVLDMQRHIRNGLLEVGQNSFTPDEARAVDKELQKILKAEIAAKDIADIYFEKVELSLDSLSPLTESYYRIWVLVQVDEGRLQLVREHLLKGLEKGGHSKLASAIRAQAPTDPKPSK